jgi:predicted Zn-dependent protease
VSLGLLAGVAGCAVNPVTGRSELALLQFTEAQEITLGQKAFAPTIQKMGGEVNDPKLQAYINKTGQGLARASSRPNLPYRFSIVNESSPNAFALPGGFIAITRGLLVNLTSEAQLAAILGHEIGHVDARHSVQGMQRGMLLNLGLSVLSGTTDQTAYGPFAQQAGALAAQLTENSYSREQEREADRLGIDYLVKTAYDPRGAVQVQDYFYRQLEGGAEPQWLSGLFRTHPFSKERLLANQEYIARQYPAATGSAYRLAAEPFQQAIAPLLKTREGYALYDQAQEFERNGQLDKAIATYLQAAAKAPEEALILTGLGTAYLQVEELNSARIYLTKAVRLDGNYYKSRLGLGFVHLQRKEGVQAVAELEKSMELAPTLQGGYLLAESYEQTGQTQKAKGLYQSVAEADPQGKIGQAAGARVSALRGK